MKKRLWAILLSICLVMTLLPNVAMAADNESETPAMSGPCGAASSESNVTWELTQNDEDSSNPTYTLTISGTGAMADYDVGGNRAPWYNSLLQKGATTTAYSGKTFVNITKVVITSGVTHIGAYAFAYTTVLDIQIADGVTSIGKGAFLWANWLKNITIPSSVTNMHYDSEKNEYYNIFDGTFYLESVEISGTDSPYQVVQGGVLVGLVQGKTDEYIIINCPDNLGGGNTKEITTDGFPTNTTMVAAAAFSSCRSLETITLPDTITFLGASVFAKCLSLKSFEVPDGVTMLPPYVFSGCAELESIEFNNVETLSSPVCGSVGTPETDNLTHACSSLKTLVLSKVKEIPANAFPESAIESVTIADQAKIHAKAFLNLTSLKSVTFLGGYTIVADSDGNDKPFQGCKNIETVTFNSNGVENAKVTISDNMFVDCTKLTSIDLSNVSLNDGKIGENAFKGCTALSEVKFAANTKTISQNAFSGCTALTAVDLANSKIETIGNDAFLNCTSLATLSLPTRSLTSIGANAFNENAIKHITIPSSVTTIENAAFANCSALEQITMSRDWSGKFSNTVKAPKGYAVGLRWYKEDGTQVTNLTSCFSSGSTTPQTFGYVPIFFFDVEYNGAKSHEYPYRTIYKASNMSVLSAHEVKDYRNSTLSITAPSGKTFAGWTLSDDGIEVITAGSTFAANPAPDKSTPGSFGNTPTVTLYARWVDGGKTVIENDVIDQSVQTATYDGAEKSFEVKAAADKILPTDVTFTVAYQNAKGESVVSPADAGTYDVTISYSGDASYAAFQLTIKGGLVITKASSTVTPAENTKTATYGETVELKVTTDINKTGAANGIAMISANSVPTVNPNTVGFYNGETLLGTATVTYGEGGQGTATLSYDTIKKGLSIGENTVTAYYGGNDNLEQSAVAGTITVTLNKATLTITGLTATNRPYDSTTNVTLTGGILSGVLGSDAVTATMPTSGTLTDANVGTGKLVSVPTITLTGDHEVLLYYTLTQPTGLTVNIAKATPVISIAADKESFKGSGTVKLTVTGTPTTEGTVTVTCGENTYTPSLENGKYVVTVDLPNETKDYDFTASYTAAENGNYENAQSNACKVSVARRSSGGGSSSDPTYSVTTPSASNGSVTVSPKNASKGDTVTVTVKPDSGYVLETLTVTDKNGNELTLKDKGNGKYTFTMPASKVEIKATFVKEVETSPFSDVSTNAYYYEAVKWAQEKGITGGIGNGLFGPNQPCTRAQIVTFLWRAAGSPEPKSMSSFSDVSTDSYYAKAAAWAVENGITTGTGDGKFSPDATCTRAQSVTFLFRAIGKLVDSKAEFSDVLTDSYYANAVAWAVENGVTNGIGDGLFGPDNSCTRAQIVTFLFRAYQGK